MHQIDLSKDGKHLDEVFGLVLNKLPDLRLPPALILAGEDDFINKTRFIKLTPIKKQKYYDFHKREVKNQPQCETSLKGPNIPSKAICETKLGDNRKNLTSKATISLSDQYSIEFEKQRKRFERIKRARYCYSRCRIKKKEKQKEESGYNKLQVKPREINYPFAEPIPESMRTDQKVDNLKDIVTMESIDWKMLTPVRPNNEKEEEYFERLVLLHRKRYEEQKKLKQQLDNEASFKHIRHRYLMQYNLRNKEVFVPLVTKTIESTSVQRNSSSDCLKDILWDVPRLTVSSEGNVTEPNTHHFKRHYKNLTHHDSTSTNQNRTRHENMEDKTSIDIIKEYSQESESINDLMDDRIEEIVENLMSASLEVEIN